jgi:uncharacterized protein
MPLIPYALPIVLLIGSNAFMTTAWYWHLRYKEVPITWVILISWSLAFFEYCMAVPANRYGSAVYDSAQLKTIQELVTLSVFAVFSTVYLKDPLTWSQGRLRADSGRRVLRVPQVLKLTFPSADDMQPAHERGNGGDFLVPAVARR